MSKLKWAYSIVLQTMWNGKYIENNTNWRGNVFAWSELIKLTSAIKLRVMHRLLSYLARAWLKSDAEIDFLFIPNRYIHWLRRSRAGVLLSFLQWSQLTPGFSIITRHKQHKKMREKMLLLKTMMQANSTLVCFFSPIFLNAIYQVFFTERERERVTPRKVSNGDISYDTRSQFQSEKKCSLSLLWPLIPVWYGYTMEIMY